MSKFSTEEKIRVVLDGMRYPEEITGLCRQVGISRSTYYHWQRTLLEKGIKGYAIFRQYHTAAPTARVIRKGRKSWSVPAFTLVLVLGL